MEYETRKSARAKYLRVTVYPDMRVVVTLPSRVSLRAAEDFIERKKEWLERALARLARQPRQIALPATRADFLAGKEALRASIERRMLELREIYGFAYARVAVRNQATLWGSCSRRGVVSFNYALAHLPPELAEYVIVHEFCHLGELNHSRNFWALVEKTLPNHRALRKELRTYRLGLR